MALKCGEDKPPLSSVILLSQLLLIVAAQSPSASSPIKTVVVLVMENRSFDHMLGWMKQKVNPEIDGVDGSQFNPISTTDPNSARLFFGKESHLVDPDPSHSFEAIREQIFGSNHSSSTDPPPMNGFAQQAAAVDPSMSRSVMNGFDPDLIPVYKTLVSEFAVFDRWFASVPASTQPNRLYVHSGTSHGSISNVPSLLARGYPQRTIFESLDESGIDFGIYYQNIPTTLFYRNLRKLKYAGKFHPYGLSFKSDARKGKLPGYVVVEQRYVDSVLEPANDDHPSHDVYQGQMLVKEVYETLRSSPQWNQTLLLITYDEHGGFYDHAPTPLSGVPSPDGIVGPDPSYFNFDRLGVRVPTIAVSPWIEKATVVHGPNGSPFPNSEYEHSSIPATVKKIFNLRSPFLTRRDAWAGTFESILQKRKEPRTDCPEQLPTPKKIRNGGPNVKAEISEFQHELVQLAAALNGDHLLTSFPENIDRNMTIRQVKEYLEGAVKRFFKASLSAKAMGVDGDQIVQMRPSLTSRRSSNP